MYGKHFASMYEGSMMGAGPVVFAVWGYVISKTVSGEVELNPRLISVLIGCTPEEVEEAIEYLCRPDAESRNSDQEGRRLVKNGAFSYDVVSHAIYNRMRNTDDRREYNRKKQAEYRAAKKKSVQSVQSVPRSAHTDTDTDTEEKKKEPRSPKGKVGQCEEILDVFNSAFKLQCRMTASRRKTLLIRLKDEWWSENWQAAIEKGSRSDFLTGKNDRGWKIDFEFFLKPETVTKILEGKYSPAEQKKKPRLPDYTTPEGMAQLKKDFLGNLHT